MQGFVDHSERFGFVSPRGMGKPYFCFQKRALVFCGEQIVGDKRGSRQASKKAISVKIRIG